MRVSTHIAFAIFLGLAVFRVTGVDTYGLVAAFFHIFPLVDIALKKPCRGEPFHTVFGFIIAVLAIMNIDKLWMTWLVWGYVSHFVLDLLVSEGLQLGWPLIGGRQRFVIPKADKITFWASVAGIILVTIF